MLVIYVRRRKFSDKFIYNLIRSAKLEQSLEIFEIKYNFSFIHVGFIQAEFAMHWMKF